MGSPNITKKGIKGVPHSLPKKKKESKGFPIEYQKTKKEKELKGVKKGNQRRPR